MFPWWASVLLVLTHILLFGAGAVAYHLIRVLSVRPIGPFPNKMVSDAKLAEIADKIARKQVAGDRFGRQFEPLPDMVVKRQVYEQGDGRSKEETFVPAK